MHPEALQFVSEVVHQLPPRRLVVELGSRNVNGSVKPMFADAERYLGCDLEPGPGVDVVCPAEDFNPPYTPDTVVCVSVLEHTPRGPEVLANAFRMLGQGGVLILSCATDPWPPHSAVDGGELFDGEYYGNVAPAEMEAWLEAAGFEHHDVSYTPQGDLFVVAAKGAPPAQVTRMAPDLPSIETGMTVPEARLLRELARDQLVLELGVWQGFSTVVMARVARQVHAVDHFQGDPMSGQRDTLGAAWANLERFGVRDRVTLHIGRFEQVLELFEPARFDLVFIDGFHSGEAVTADYELASRLVRPDGVLAFHDYGRYGVQPAVDSIARALQLQVHLTDSLAVLELCKQEVLR